MTHQTIDTAILRTTGGFPPEKLIVTKNDEGDPEVGMFFMDEDMQLFWIKYDVEGAISFHLEDLESVLFRPDQLDFIRKMGSLAKHTWKDLQRFWNPKSARWEGFDEMLTAPEERYKLATLDPEEATPH